MFVITGCQVMDGDAYCWVVGVVNTIEEVDTTIENAKQRYVEDYDTPHYDDGVEFEYHEVNGTFCKKV